MAEAGYPRDLHGYGRNPPDPRWPGNARVAVQFVVNFEEGGENNILHGDRASEAFLSDVLGAQPWPGQRHANIESVFEIWLARRLLAPLADLHRAQAADHGLRRRDRPEAKSRNCRGHEGGGLGYCQP